ncbi:MAG: phosphotransferase [Shinella sp.]|uniref:phosphotransferase n=1 Tax=Shinella sp. TaxID=1870904 RepID=UPI0040364078
MQSQINRVADGKSGALPPILATADPARAPDRTGGEGESLLTSSGPRITPGDAADLARQFYGIEGKVRALSSERDANFHIQLADGAQALLKVSNSMEDRAETGMQTAALMHLAAVDPDLPVQRIHATTDGAAWVLIDGPAGDRHIVRLMSYIEGTMLSIAEPLPGLHFEIGRTLARLTRALRGFFHPSSGRFLQWDIKHARRLRPMLETVEEPDLKSRLTRLLARFDAEIGPRLPHLRAQTVHNDFNPHNIVVDGPRAARVTGVIDFGDMVTTPNVCDLAIACSYHLNGGNDPLLPVEDLVAGYASVLPLEAEELSLLPDLIRLRHATTLAITSWRARKYPENAAYILRNAAASRRGLDILDSLDPSKTNDALTRAAARDSSTANAGSNRP